MNESEKEKSRLQSELDRLRKMVVRLQDSLALHHTVVEEKLESQSAVLANIIATIPHYVFWKDKNFIYLGCNSQFAQFSGLREPSEVIGKTDFDLAWKKEEADYHRACDQQVLDSGKPMLNVEEALLRPDGKVATFLSSKVPLRDASGALTGVLGILTDITERKQLESHLKQTQKIEAIRRLAGGVAHDFNNLLTVIAGYAEMRLEILKQDDPLRGDFEQILKAAERAKVLTSQLLAFSRQQVIQPQVVQLNDQLIRLSSMLRRLIPEHIELVMLPAQDLGLVKMDVGQFEQVLVTLVANARDAMPDGGKIVIQTRNDSLDRDYELTHMGVKAGDYVMICVSDSGAGMSEETRQRVFEPFFSTKEKNKGFGLGLATSYGIIRQAGGFITFASELQKGSIFKIYLPRISDRQSALPLKTPGIKKTLTGNETILLVEDEPMVRALSLTILRDHGYQVLEAANGEEALRVAEQFGKKTIHLLLTDVIMPQMGGKELAEKLKPKRPDTLILFASGYTDDTIVQQRVIEFGDHFIQKPFTPNSLATKVREILDSKKSD